jgi:hypothetical protein
MAAGDAEVEGDRLDAWAARRGDPACEHATSTAHATRVADTRLVGATAPHRIAIARTTAQDG